MVKQKNKLWGQVEKIVQCKAARIGGGKKYRIKLIGVDKLVWVHSKQLSKGVEKTYEADGTLVKGATAHVDRYYVNAQKTFLKRKVSVLLFLHVVFTVLDYVHAQTTDVDPVKTGRRVAGWVQIAQTYVEAMNKVLKTNVSERCSAFSAMLESLRPSKVVLDHVKMSDYLDGTLVVWRGTQNVFSPNKKDPQSLMCTCCGTSHKFARIDRVLIHLMSKKHHVKCKEQCEALTQARSQNLLNEHCQAASSTCDRCT